MATIYLSYKLEEQHLATELAHDLEQMGHRAVYDALALKPGKEWRQVLMDALTASDAFVLLLSERSLASPFVMGELGAARALYNAFNQMLIVPVLIDRIPIPPIVSDLFVVQMTQEHNAVSKIASEIDVALQHHLTQSHRAHPRLFISHRHNDSSVAQALVSVIEAAFVVEKSDLRCTSIHPYRLRVGDRTSDRIRSEIHRAEAVLGILTPDTKTSSYVLFELGASWGRGVITFPLLAKGASLTDIPAPIGDLHTLSLADQADCYQLIDDLASVLSLPRQENSATQLTQRIAELVKASQQVTML